MHANGTHAHRDSCRLGRAASSRQPAVPYIMSVYLDFPPAVPSPVKISTRADRVITRKDEIQKPEVKNEVLAHHDVHRLTNSDVSTRSDSDSDSEPRPSAAAAFQLQPLIRTPRLRVVRTVTVETFKTELELERNYHPMKSGTGLAASAGLNKLYLAAADLGWPL